MDECEIMDKVEKVPKDGGKCENPSDEAAEEEESLEEVYSKVGQSHPEGVRGSRATAANIIVKTGFTIIDGMEI